MGNEEVQKLLVQVLNICNVENPEGILTQNYSDLNEKSRVSKPSFVQIVSQAIEKVQFKAKDVMSRKQREIIEE